MDSNLNDEATNSLVNPILLPELQEFTGMDDDLDDVDGSAMGERLHPQTLLGLHDIQTSIDPDSGCGMSLKSSDFSSSMREGTSSSNSIRNISSGVADMSLGNVQEEEEIESEDEAYESNDKLADKFRPPNTRLEQISIVSMDSVGGSKIDFPKTDSSNESQVEYDSQKTPKDSDFFQQRWRTTERIFTQDEDGDTQLHLAIIQGDINLSLGMLNFAVGSDCLNTANLLGQTLLHLAALTNQGYVARELVKKGAQLDIRDHHGNTPLHLACRDGHLNVVKALTMSLTTEMARHVPLQSIPQDMNMKNYEGLTCLHLAAINNHLSVISYLAEQPVNYNVDMKDSCSGRTILHYAADRKLEDLSRLLLYHCKADPNTRTFDGTTPLQVAAGRRHDAIVSLLLDSGADDSQLQSDSFDESSSDEEEEMMIEQETLQHFNPGIACS